MTGRNWPERVVVIGHFYADSFAENIHRSLIEMNINAVAVDSRSSATRGAQRSVRVRKVAKFVEETASRSRPPAPAR